MVTTAEQKFDIDSLYALARDRSAAARTALAETVGDLFFGRADILTARERSLMGEILHTLISDVEQSVRSALSERLADHPDAPRDLVLALANDEIEVAHPILIRSAVLQDLELIEVIRHRTMRHHLAIAMREALSEAVSDELVATGEQSVIRTLLENGEARISQKTLEYLVDQSQDVGVYQRPLLCRHDLDPDLAKRMYCWVSAALRRHIVEHFEVDIRELDETIGRTIEDLMQEVRERAGPGDRPPVEVAELLAHANALSPRFLIELLREGEIPLFEGVFAEMAGLRLSLVRRFLYEPGGEALAICCRAMKVSKADFASIFLLSRQARPGDKVVDPDELPKALTVFDKVRSDVAEAVLQRWRLDPDYLYAVKRLEDDEPAEPSHWQPAVA